MGPDDGGGNAFSYDHYNSMWQRMRNIITRHSLMRLVTQLDMKYSEDQPLIFHYISREVGNYLERFYFIKKGRLIIAGSYIIAFIKFCFVSLFDMFHISVK